MATIEDVARAAGVGLGTASRALNGSPGVAGQTRERVLAAARELGYQRSPIARAFSRQRTNTLEILVPYLTRHFYMEVLRGVEEALADTDYSIVIRSMEHLADRDRAFAACCVRGRADGVLFVSVLPSDEVVERLELGAFPAVVVDGVRPGVSSVAVDHAGGMLAATRHCIELGHRRMALVDHQEDPFVRAVPTERQLGFRRGLAEAGIEVPAAYEQITDYSAEAGALALDQLMALPEPPTAILIGSDVQALGVVHQALLWWPNNPGSMPPGPPPGARVVFRGRRGGGPGGIEPC